MAVVGSAEFEVRANAAKAKEDIKAFERDLKGSLGQMEGDANRSAGAIGDSFGKLASFARAGIGAVVAIAALAVAGMVNLSFAALKTADDIANTARRIGIGTDALQEWRYVAKATGEDAAAADRALDSFATKLAQASAGTSKEASKGFNLLGLKADDLKKYTSVEAALDDITERIKDLKNEADRVAVAEALGLGPLSNALRDASVDIASLRDEARSLGIVMDAELVKRASDAQEKFDTLAQIIDVQLKSAFIDLAPAIMAAIKLVADLATALADAMDSWRRLDDRTSRGLDRQKEMMTRENSALMLQYGSPEAMRGRRTGNPALGSAGGAAGVGGSLSALNAGPDNFARFQENNRRIAEISRLQAERAADGPPARSDRADGGSLTLPAGRTPRERVDRSAEREARRAERVEQEIFRARQRLLGVAEGDLLTAEQRYDLARDQLAMDREARDAEIASKEDREEYTKTEADKLRLAHEEADILEDRIMLDNSIRDIRDEELANAQLLSDLTADLVGLQLAGARTAKERQRLELELLEITQRQRRDALERELDKNPKLSPEEKAARWEINRQREAGENAAVRRSNQTPLAEWRDQSLKTAGEVSEAFEAIAARGLDSLNDGIVDAIMNSKSLGEVFSRVAQQILADLLKIAVRRGITEPLANALFGGSEGATGGGGGGWMSAIASLFGKVKIPGFASGVTNFSGGLAYVHQGEVLANLAPGTDVIPAHAVGRGGGGSPVHFDLRGAVMTSDLLQQMEGMASQSSGASVQAARHVVPADMAKTSRYSLGRR